MHGGAKGSGAPIGNRNAWKHGRYSAEHLKEMKRFRELIRESEETIEAIS